MLLEIEPQETFDFMNKINGKNLKKNWYSTNIDEITI